MLLLLLLLLLLLVPPPPPPRCGGKHTRHLRSPAGRFHWPFV
jgi:hypothetical protein